MSPSVGFPLFFLVTLALLGGVVVTGRKAQRRRHIPLVACTVVALGTTIYFAEKLGELYDLETAGFMYPLHLFVAKVTVVLYLLPLITGPMTMRNPVHLVWHRRVAYLTLVATVLTAVTGCLMTWMAERL